MEAVSISETSVCFCETTRRDILEGRDLLKALDCEWKRVISKIKLKTNMKEEVREFENSNRKFEWKEIK
jgi:hypothetical protein